MLEPCHLHGDNGYVKTWPKKKSLSHRSMGEQLARLQRARAKRAPSRMVFHLGVIKIVIIKLKWNMLKAKV